MNLRDYEQTKFQLAEALRSSGASDSQQPRQIQEQVRDLFSRLAEDRFNLVVVGRFSRGKTSLMNAVLGVDRLPTGIRPITSVITTVTYGSTEKVIIHYSGFGIPAEISLAELPQFVTEQGNSGNYRRVSIAEVQLPVELLRRGFHFIDTPGLGSPIIENTRTTKRFLPEADAFILVTSHEGPLSDEEVRFLRSASAAAQPVFIVVNKQDLADSAERAEALRYMREQLQDLLGGRGLGIFSLSAREGLAAKQKQDARLLAASGVAAFEAELVQFLINEKSREFLLRMCQRISAVVAELPNCDETARASEHVAAIARGIGGNRTVQIAAGSGSALEAVAAPSATPSQSCEICGHVANKCFDFLRTFQYEITVNPKRQEHLAELGGLCTFHTWMYEQLASPQGTCIGFAGVLDRWASRLFALAVPDTGPSSNAADPNPMRVPEATACPVCKIRSAAESAAVASIAKRLRQNPESALNSLSHICLPHLRLLVAEIGDASVATKLLVREAATLRRLSEDMRRYALKRDGARRYLASDEETNAAQHALLSLAGHRTLNTPEPRG
ncbi:MAG: dynamin family protein [Roseiarcus sp.]